jgi:predicted secreted hydrolase
MEDGNIHLKASSEVHALDLTLTPLKPPVLHGEQGFSTKGNNPGQASHYYSFTRLRARGSLKTKGEILPVSGLAWMDHEFGSSIMLPDQSGWDWFSVQLEDDTELMVFNMRKRDNTKERHFGTYVFPDGAKRDLKDMDVEIRALDTWKSEKTKAVYPSGWEITVRELDLELTVQPLLKDQELISEGSTGVVYWEGAVEVTGVKNKEKIQGQGYVELTGYAHSMAGRL